MKLYQLFCILILFIDSNSYSKELSKQTTENLFYQTFKYTDKPERIGRSAYHFTLFLRNPNTKWFGTIYSDELAKKLKSQPQNQKHTSNFPSKEFKSIAGNYTAITQGMVSASINTKENGSFTINSIDDWTIPKNGTVDIDYGATFECVEDKNGGKNCTAPTKKLKKFKH